MMVKGQNNRRKRLYPLLIVAVVVLAVALGISHFAISKTANRARRMDKSELLAYNSALTTRAHTSDWIDPDMVLVLHSLQKDGNADAQAEFSIYQLPEGVKADDFLSLHAGQIQEKDGLVYMGTLSCRIPADQPLSAYDFHLSFIR
jgi:hypothetical protein